jgi:hypothetical protein
MRRPHFEGESCLSKQLAAARRRRSKNQHIEIMAAATHRPTSAPK